MKKLFYLATLIAMASCQNTKNTPAIDPTNLDASIAPNEDFYQYATGGWQRKNPLKPEFSRYGSFDVLRENNEKRINELFSAMAGSQAAAGSVEQKIADLYKMGLDSARRNEAGLEPVRADLERIYAIGDARALAPVLAAIHSACGNPLFAMGVEADLMNSSMNALYISQAGLGMGNRDYYLDEEHSPLREGYAAFLTKAFELAGLEQAADRAARVLAFETKLAEKFRSNVELRNIAASYNPMTKEQFTQRYANIDWTAYLAGVGCGDFETIIVGQPEVLDLVNALVASEPVETLRDYLAASTLRSAAAHDLRHKEDDDDEAEHDEEEPHAVPHHDEEEGDDHDPAREELGKGLRDELTEGIDIVGIVTHDIAVAVRIEVFDGKLLHSVEHLLPHLFQIALRDDRHQLFIHRARGEGEHVQPDEGKHVRRDLPSASFPIRHEVALIPEDGEDALHEDGGKRGDDRVEHDEGEREGEHPRIVVEDGLQNALERPLGRLHGGAARTAGTRCHFRHYRHLLRRPYRDLSAR